MQFHTRKTVDEFHAPTFKIIRRSHVLTWYQNIIVCEMFESFKRFWRIQIIESSNYFFKIKLGKEHITNEQSICLEQHGNGYKIKGVSRNQQLSLAAGYENNNDLGVFFNGRRCHSLIFSPMIIHKTQFKYTQFFLLFFICNFYIFFIRCCRHYPSWRTAAKNVKHGCC